MKKFLLSVMCAFSLYANAQGIIVHETNNNQTSYKTADVQRIEFSETVTESTGSTYATKQELNQKADKSDVSSLVNRIADLEKSIAEIQSVFGSSSDVKTYHNGYEYVDLGLPSGLKWATCNVGSSLPVGSGDYIAWGETEVKSEYTLNTYFDSVDGSLSNYDKYAKDKKTVLDLEDDVAHVKMGGNWRMPTKDEWDELKNKCNWEWYTIVGVNGRKVTGPNGKSIFLPAAGYRRNSSLNSAGTWGFYWSSSLGKDYSSNAYVLELYSNSVRWADGSRYYGYSVRAVCP